MPSSRSVKLAGHVGPLRVLPLAKLLATGQILLLAREHLTRLEPHERRRVIELVARGRGRRRNLSPAERAELGWLIAKADPRQFAGQVANKFSPVPLPARLVNGRRRGQRARP